MKHNITAIANEFNTIANSLGEIFIDFLSKPTYDKGNNFFMKYLPDEHDDIVIASGCTRAVVVAPNSNYVFKFQFLPCNVDDEDYDPECEINYGKNEEYVYSKAVERGLEEYLAWTAYIGDFFGTPVYAMEKVVVDSCRISDESFSYHARLYKEETGEDYESGDYSDHEGMFDYAAEVDGDRIRELEDLFIELGVNDCHAGNWGYRGAMLVVTDYAGYEVRIVD